MDERTERKLTDLSGMNRAVYDLLQQAWERGRKYGNEEKKDIIKALQPAIETTIETMREIVNNPDFANLMLEHPGEWIEGTQGYFCSKCDYYDTQHYEHKFCPNCGVRMITASEGRQ